MIKAISAIIGVILPILIANYVSKLIRVWAKLCWLKYKHGRYVQIYYFPIIGRRWISRNDVINHQDAMHSRKQVLI
jgi:hypothetical protein